MSHTSRPVPAKRIFASLSEPQRHWPTREADGVPYISEMLDLRQLHIDQSRQDALRYLALASRARDSEKWGVYMHCAAQCRRKLAAWKQEAANG